MPKNLIFNVCRRHDFVPKEHFILDPKSEITPSHLRDNGRAKGQHFAESSFSKILQTPLPLIGFPDSIVWHLSGSGVYSTSSGYELAFRLKKSKKPCKDFVHIQDELLCLSTWEIHVQPKLKFFIWRMLHRINPTMDCLIVRNAEVQPSCLVCHAADESLEHLLFECPISLAFYRMTRLTPPPFINTHFVIHWRIILQQQRDLAPAWILA
ncbi:hypothetical protein LINPERPRIM_LOCUS32849 [Linum perenne]